MKLVEKNANTTLVDMVGTLRSSSEEYYSIHFHLSSLMEQYKSNYQIKIAINILTDLFKGNDCVIFLLPNQDLVILYHGNDRSLLEKSIFQLRYLFMDDPLSYTNDGFENSDFCSVYDLEFQWQDFFRVCKQLYSSNLETSSEKTKKTAIQEATNNKKTNNLSSDGNSLAKKRFTPSALDGIIKKMDDIDIKKVLYHQPICALPKNSQSPKPLYYETYFHIASLQNALNVKTDLLSNHCLFKYLTYSLDKKVLEHYINNSKTLKTPLCININIQSLTSDLFLKLDKLIHPAIKKKSVIFEIHVSDVFENISRFIAISNAVKREGYQLCIDGLDDTSIMYVNPAELGFNLTKLQWNPKMVVSNQQKSLQKLSERVKELQANRIILCRCDNEEAIKYGHSLGISLFQGWHIDKLLSK